MRAFLKAEIMGKTIRWSWFITEEFPDPERGAEMRRVSGERESLG